jgi:hypothetical protein
MLSFKGIGRPLARIVGGKYDGKTIYLYDPKEKYRCCDECNDKCKGKKRCCGNCKMKKGICEGGSSENGDEHLIEAEEPFALVASMFSRKNSTNNGGKNPKYLKPTKLNQMRKALESKIEPLEEELNNWYRLAMNELSQKEKNELVLTSGHFVPIPPGKAWTCIYIAGPSGSGKSTWIANYGHEYLRAFPGNKFWLISRKSEDKVLDNENPIRIVLNEELIESPIEPKEVSNSLVVLDDVDTIPNKGIKDNIMKLRSDLIETSRSEGVSVLCSGHQIMNYKNTRDLLNEATMVVIFPKTTMYQAKRYLKEYMGLEKAAIEKIVNLPSRWVCVMKTYPICILSETEVFLVNP